jgi:hypothetical protein
MLDSVLLDWKMLDRGAMTRNVLLSTLEGSSLKNRRRELLNILGWFIDCGGYVLSELLQMRVVAKSRPVIGRQSVRQCGHQIILANLEAKERVGLSMFRGGRNFAMRGLHAHDVFEVRAASDLTVYRRCVGTHSVLSHIRPGA